MSARSAYARKKITDRESKKPRSQRPSIPDLHDDYNHNGVPIGLAPEYAGSLGTGVPTANARFLKFSAVPPSSGPGVSDNGGYSYSTYGSSVSGRGDPSTMPTSRGSGGSRAPDEFGMMPQNQHQLQHQNHQQLQLQLQLQLQQQQLQQLQHLQQLQYQQQLQQHQQQQQTHHRPALRIEDSSGIEKSGLRSLVDKRSDDVRRGLAKTFAFKKSKDKADERSLESDHHPALQSTFSEPDFGQLPETKHQLLGSMRSGRSGRFHSHMASPTIQQQHPPLPSLQTFHHQQQQQQQQPPIMSYMPQSPPYQSPYQSPPYQHDVWGNRVQQPPHFGQLPPTPTMAATAAPPIKRWVGAGRPVQKWNKLRKDPELWDPNGDVLVFLGHRHQHPRPPASFRLSSHIIEATESRPLITLLREGTTEADDADTNGVPAPLMVRSGMPTSPPPGLVAANGGGGQPTPPLSEDASVSDVDGQISYEMFFSPPANLSGSEQLRHQLTTRNIFALLYHASLVGLSLYQALVDLHARLDAYMSPEADILADMINYICARGIDDVRADPESAVGLLAWTESPDVRWEDGWRECFVHCVGMFPSLARCADFAYLTPITRALLERAFLETQLRVRSAEERLAVFQFADMWPQTGAVASQGRAAAARLQKFLLSHYSHSYGQWPPRPGCIGPSSSAMPPDTPIRLEADEGDDKDGDGVWLNRSVTQALQRDFGALYDYLVNRDIVWDGSEFRSGRKWVMVSEVGDRSFEADLPDLPMTDMLIEFDNRFRYPHIPHPYPLVPESITSGGSTKETSSASSMFKTVSRKNSMPSIKSNGLGNLERRIQLAYTESTNIYTLGSDFTHSDLIEAFVRFEKTDRIGEVDPAVARRGRWVLIYGILQTLASVSVDTPNLRYSDGVPYHLSPHVKGANVPHWRTQQNEGDEAGGDAAGGVAFGAWQEASHDQSHCWTVQRMWNTKQPSHPQGSSFGEGSQRGRSQSRGRHGAGQSAAAAGRPLVASPTGGSYGFPPSSAFSPTIRNAVSEENENVLSRRGMTAAAVAAAAPYNNNNNNMHGPHKPARDNGNGNGSGRGSVGSGATFGGDNRPLGSVSPPSAAELEFLMNRRRELGDTVSEISTFAGERCYTPSMLSVNFSGSGFMGLDDAAMYGGGRGQMGRAGQVMRPNEQQPGMGDEEDAYAGGELYKVRTMLSRM